MWFGVIWESVACFSMPDILDKIFNQIYHVAKNGTYLMDPEMTRGKVDIFGIWTQ